MLNTVAVEVVQQGVPANRDRIDRTVRGGFHRCPGTPDADGHDTSLPRAGKNATHHSRPGPHRDSERWSA
jgi:hypothetical protein